MTLSFEELADHDTAMGNLNLRRRRTPGSDVDIFEVKLGDEFLMSSLFTVAEVALATLGLAAVEEGADDLDVIVGGLGLGYTAWTALGDDRVRSVRVVEALAPVIEWHERDLLPDVAGMAADPRCSLVHGDFFALAAGDIGFDADQPGRRFDALLVDIDHTPRHVLHPSHAPFYTPEGLRRMARYLAPGGVFALWSDDPPDAEFVAILEQVFTESTAAHIVAFANPHTGGESTNTVYVAR